MDGTQDVTKSDATNPRLSRRLKRALLTTLLAILILATAAAAVSSYLESSNIQDETLLSVARLVESNQISSPKKAQLYDDDHLDDGAVSVWEVGTANRHGFSIKKRLKEGFHTVHEDDEFWRIYLSRKNKSGKQYFVAQQLSVSTELAFKSAVNTAIPLLLLFLLIPLLITLIVRHSFKPLNALTDKVDGSDSLKLDLVDETQIPVEVLPFISAIDSLLEKNDAYNIRQRRFIADAAHELRTPITALSLEIENVQSAKNEVTKNQRQASLAKSVARLQRLLNQLLDLARAQSVTAESKTIISFNELVKTQVADIYLLAEDKGIELAVSRNEDVQVYDINNQLQHLVRNALSNATKFTPEFGTVDIEIYQQGGQAVFCVNDSGPGVDEENLAKLHEPFYRPDGQASGTGAGLGLAICHEIASHLSGKIELSNISPKGFRFCYTQAAV